PGPGPDRRLPRPDGRPCEAKRTARDRLHGRDQAVPAPDRVPADDARDGADLAGWGAWGSRSVARRSIWSASVPVLRRCTPGSARMRGDTVPTVLQQRNVPEAMRSLSTLAKPDYVDLFTVTAGAAADRSPEQWARPGSKTPRWLAG